MVVVHARNSTSNKVSKSLSRPALGQFVHVGGEVSLLSATEQVLIRTFLHIPQRITTMHTHTRSVARGSAVLTAAELSELQVNITAHVNRRMSLDH